MQLIKILQPTIIISDIQMGALFPIDLVLQLIKITLELQVGLKKLVTIVLPTAVMRLLDCSSHCKMIAKKTCYMHHFKITYILLNR